MRPTWRVAGAAALWLVLEWYGAESEVSWLFLLAAWVLALIAVSAVYAVWNRGGLRLHLAAKGTTPSSATASATRHWHIRWVGVAFQRSRYVRSWISQLAAFVPT